VKKILYKFLIKKCYKKPIMIRFRVFDIDRHTHTHTHTKHAHTIFQRHNI